MVTYVTAFASAGYAPISVPVLETALTNVSDLTDIIFRGSGSAFAGVIVTSSRACEAWKVAVQSTIADAPSSSNSQTSWSSIPFYVVGNATASALSSLHELFSTTPQQHLVPSPSMIQGQDCGNADNLARFIVQDLEGKNDQSKLLYLTGDKNRESLPSILNEASVRFDQLEVYGTQGSSTFKDDLGRIMEDHSQAKDWWIVFFAPSSAQFAIPVLETYFALPRVAGSPGGTHPSAKIAAIGRTTLAFLRDTLHLQVAATASKPNPDCLLSAIRGAES
ncbi:hypothetical protein APHAL10511_005212 [Amanita phalloides]|nr:hypothetical protein APHAL10511_005212 [Amanita phalloides]